MFFWLAALADGSVDGPPERLQVGRCIAGAVSLRAVAAVAPGGVSTALKPIYAGETNYQITADVAFHCARRKPCTSINGANRWWLWLAVIFVAGAGVYVWAARANSPRATAIVPAIPVSATRVKQSDLHIYLSQIGTVTPFATVTVRSQLAGQIMAVNFKEGQMVDVGQLLFEIDSRPYRAELVEYQGQLARDKATLANAQVTLDRYRSLFRQGVIAQQDLDNQRALYGQARGAIENDQGLIDAVKVNLAYCRIVSPIKGRIGLRQVDLGNYVQPSDALVVITRLQPISVIFSVPEDDIQEIVKDMSAGQVSVQAWDRSFGKQLAGGFLLTFDNEIDQATGTVKLRAEFPNDNYALFPGEFVNARLLVKTMHDTMLVPTAAVQQTQRTAYVYVVEPNQTVMRREVVVGPAQDDLTAHRRGVSVGEAVVTDGLDKLQPGGKVAVRMNPALRRRQVRLSRREIKPPNESCRGHFILRPVATSSADGGDPAGGRGGLSSSCRSRRCREVDYPTIQVLTFYPGASPDVMASSVTAPLERQFGQVPGLNQMTSTSSFGSSVITLQFDLDLNIDVAEQEVQAAINAAATYLPTRSAEPADLQQDQSGRRADPDAGADLDRVAA